MNVLLFGGTLKEICVSAVFFAFTYCGSLAVTSMVCVQIRPDVEQAKEVFLAVHESLFTMIEKLMPHTTVYQAVKVP